MRIRIWFDRVSILGLAVLTAAAASSRAEPLAGQVMAQAPAYDGESWSQYYRSGRSMAIKAGSGGHFFTDAAVRGGSVRFMIDTGATSIILTKADADRLGIELNDGDFTQQYMTAAGIVRAAPVTLDDLRIGSLVLRNVKVSVTRSGSGVSVLGMTFLKRLQRYEVKGDELMLYW
jgi:aspartyl protease family protein